MTVCDAEVHLVLKSSSAKSGRIKIKERCIHADREHFNIIIIPKMGYAKHNSRKKQQEEAKKRKQQGRKWKLVELGLGDERDAYKIYSYF